MRIAGQIMKIKVFPAIMAIACTASCQKAPEKPANAKEGTPTAQIVAAQWIKVTENSNSGGVYVNSKSIMPYKDSGLTMAEMAIQRDDKTYRGFVEGFDCKNRLRSDLGLDGSNSSPSPVVTWQIFSHAFNFVCFKQRDPGVAKADILQNLDITYVAGE